MLSKLNSAISRAVKNSSPPSIEQLQSLRLGQAVSLKSCPSLYFVFLFFSPSFLPFFLLSFLSPSFSLSLPPTFLSLCFFYFFSPRPPFSSPPDRGSISTREVIDLVSRVFSRLVVVVQERGRSSLHRFWRLHECGCDQGASFISNVQSTIYILMELRFRSVPKGQRVLYISFQSYSTPDSLGGSDSILEDVSSESRDSSIWRGAGRRALERRCFEFPLRHARRQNRFHYHSQLLPKSAGQSLISQRLSSR